jgi:hypothetical protein
MSAQSNTINDQRNSVAVPGCCTGDSLLPLTTLCSRASAELHPEDCKAARRAMCDSTAACCSLVHGDT